MKQLLFLSVSLICLCATVLAQPEAGSGYLFNRFKDAFIYYRDGRRFNVPLNYNLITHQYIFIDKQDDNQKKEFTEPGMIVAIEVDGRTFLPPAEGATEVIQSEPPFYVSYRGMVKKEKSTAYGGTTQTASVDTYSRIRGVGQIGGTDGTQKSVAAIDKEYKVKIGKRIKRFSNEKQFLKLFSNHKEALLRYLAEKQVDFDNIRQVLDLYNYACGLTKSVVK